MKHTEWMARKGAPDAPAELVQLGRRLLGELQERSRLSGVKSLVIRRDIPGVGFVEAKLVYGQPQVICYPYPQEDEPIRPAHGLKGFVVTARIEGASLTGEYPQQILRKTEDGWTTFFFNSDVQGYDTFAGEKGKYNGRFPYGVERAGNIDWIGDEGVRLNWYGPRLRYWWDAWREADKQYGRWVFINGAALIDLDEYHSANEISEDARLVVGAALNGEYLYVMQARINSMPTIQELDAQFSAMSPYGSEVSWISPVYPEGTNDLKLCRYSLRRLEVPADDGGVFKVLNESRVVLWSKTGRGWVNPWSISPDGRAWASIAMPDELRSSSVVEYETNGFAEVYSQQLCLPSASNEVCLLSLDANDLVNEVTEISEISVESEVSESAVRVVDTALFAIDFDESGARIDLVASFIVDTINDDYRVTFQIGNGEPINMWWADARAHMMPASIDLRTRTLIRLATHYNEKKYVAVVFKNGLQVE